MQGEPNFQEQELALLKEKIRLEQDRNKLDQDRIDLNREIYKFESESKKSGAQKIFSDYSPLIVAIIALLGSIAVQVWASRSAALIQKDAAVDQFRLEVARLIMDSNDPAAADHRLQFLAQVYPTQLADLNSKKITTENLSSVDNKTLIDLLTLVYNHPEQSEEIINNWNTLRKSSLAISGVNVTPEPEKTATNDTTATTPTGSASPGEGTEITVCGKRMGVILPISWKDDSFLGALVALSNQSGSNVCDGGKINNLDEVLRLLNNYSDQTSFDHAMQKYQKTGSLFGPFQNSGATKGTPGFSTPGP